MTMTLSELLRILQRTSSPAELFGPLTGDMDAALKRRYHELVLIAHPDHNPQHVAEASAAFKQVQHYYSLAQHQIRNSTYGKAPCITATTRTQTYTGYTPPLHGDLCDLYQANADSDAAVLLKVARNPRNNDLLQREAQVLRRIARDLEGQAVRAHFPTLVEHFLLPDATGVQHHTNVLCVEEDTVSLADVLRVYPAGLSVADAAWMFNRLLAALGVVHSLGIVHGAVLPTHILIRPADHNGVLIDWCYSVATGQPLKAISLPYVADYPPEVQAKQPATPATDLYMAARCMVRLLGGAGTAESLPDHVPKAIRALLRACLLPAPHRRTADAWHLLDDFRTILGELYGPPTFRPFHMPTLAR